MRGRSRSKGPNPLTRSYESNGPDVKIRGTAQHVADKYSQLSRDAHASGDPVAAENYLQHAEHYYRLIATAQEAYRQQFGGFQRDEEGEEGDEEFGVGQGGEDYGDAPPLQGGYDRGGQGPNPGANQGQNRYERGGDRQNQNRQRFDRNGERYGQGGQDRGGQDRGQDRAGPDRGQDRGPDRNQDRGQQQPDRGERGGYQAGADRGNGGGYEPRQGGYDRPNGAEPRYDRQNGYDRQDRPDRPERRERFGRDERPRDDRGGRESFGPREARPDRGERRDARPVGYGAGEAQVDEEREDGSLPAFLTTPVRPAASVDDVAQDVGLSPTPAAPDEAEATGIRPRRRRARKADQAPEGMDETADGA